MLVDCIKENNIASVKALLKKYNIRNVAGLRNCDNNPSGSVLQLKVKGRELNEKNGNSSAR